MRYIYILHTNKLNKIILSGDNRLTYNIQNLLWS